MELDLFEIVLDPSIPDGSLVVVSRDEDGEIADAARIEGIE